MRWLADYIMRGRVQAIGTAALLGVLSWVLPPFSYLSGASVALVSLRNGAVEGLIALLGAGVISALVSLAGFGTPLPALALVVALWFPVWAAAYVLRITRSQGVMLITIGALTGGFALLMRVLGGDMEARWRGWIEEGLKQMGGQAPAVDPEALDRLAGMVNGLVAAGMTFSLAVVMLLGRWWQSLLYNPGGFGVEFKALSLGPRFSMVIIGVAVLLLIQTTLGGGYGLMVDLLIVAAVLYAFQGVAVAHAHVTSRQLPVWWLAILYFSLFAIPQLAVVLLALVGLADNFLNFRRSGNSTV
jgi:hypothetical protein